MCVDRTGCRLHSQQILPTGTGCMYREQYTACPDGIYQVGYTPHGQHVSTLPHCTYVDTRESYLLSIYDLTVKLASTTSGNTTSTVRQKVLLWHIKVTRVTIISLSYTHTAVINRERPRSSILLATVVPPPPLSSLGETRHTHFQ